MTYKKMTTYLVLSLFGLVYWGYKYVIRNYVLIKGNYNILLQSEKGMHLTNGSC